MNKKKLFDLLDSLKIEHSTIEHEPVFTVEQSNGIELKIPGGHTKNLFLKDDKKQFWLLSTLQDTKINLKRLSKQLNAKNLRFAQPDLLRQHLGIEPGSVTWFALINNTDKTVEGVLDKRLFEHDVVGFHPLQNNATTLVEPSALLTFANSVGTKHRIFDFTAE